MDEIAQTVPEPERKDALTEDDRKLIDTMIESEYPTIAVGKAVEIARADTRLGEILALDERYGAAVKKALGEENGNE